MTAIFYQIISLFLLFVLSNAQTILIVDGSASDIRGNFKVSSFGRNLVQKPQQKIRVSIQFADVRVRGCNSAFAVYDYEPIKQKISVGQFQQPGFECIIHQDRSVMEQLQLAKRAYRENNEILFQDKDGIKILKLVLSDTPFDEVLPPRISADDNDEWI